MKTSLADLPRSAYVGGTAIFSEVVTAGAALLSEFLYQQFGGYSILLLLELNVDTFILTDWEITMSICNPDL